MRPICISGEPVLHRKAESVVNITDDIRALVSDMFETMDAAPGVGLAAPQVGVGLRIFTYNWVDEANELWRGVALNPELLLSSIEPGPPNLDEESEGCLSFPGERFGLKRADRAVLRAMDLDGKSFEIDTRGWLARIFQHEFDHLNGVLYIDRLSETDHKIVQRVSKKMGWGVPGHSWKPGEDFLEP